MSKSDEGAGHNYGLNGAAKKRVMETVKSIEALMDERDEINEDIKEHFNALKLDGHDTTALRKVISAKRQRAKNPEKFDERQQQVDVYMIALGLA